MIKKLSPIKFASFSFLALFLFLLLIFSIKYGLTNPSHKEVKNNSYYSGNNSGNLLITKAPTFQEKRLEPITNGPEPVLGNKNAPISIIEFSDFECEFCSKQENVLKTILSEYGDKIKLIWKDYPDSNQNSISYQAAVAGRCAAEQGEFWKYHDILFGKTELQEKTFLDAAQEIGLNQNQFKKCFQGTEARKLVDANIKEANELDIPGIPFIYINKLELIGQTTIDEIKNIIDSELQKIK